MDGQVVIRGDSHFFLVAVGGLLRLARRYRELTGDARVSNGEARFSAAVGDAKDLRDVLEHIEDYAIGEGNLQREGKIPKVNDSLPDVHLADGDPTSEIELVFAGMAVPVKRAAAAAFELARELDAVWWERGGPS